MPAFVENLKELWQYRALLWSLIVRDLQVRYRGSFFGFLWTFLNPVLQMLVYSLVFKVYLRNNLPNYTFFLFVGLLPWNWLATSITAGASSITDRRDLITKVQFPPQILPATVIGAALVNYLLTLPLMLVLGWFFGVTPGAAVVAFPLVLLVQLLLVTGLVYLISSFNVTFRDLQHIVSNLVMFAFFLTPVLYAASQVPEPYRELLLKLNPFAALVASYQDIFVHGRWPDFANLGRVALLGTVLLMLGSSVMAARRESFAELA